jgi:hypothetical protein
MNRRDYEECAQAVEQHMNEIGLTIVTADGLLKYCPWYPPWTPPTPRNTGRPRKGSKQWRRENGIQ